MFSQCLQGILFFMPGQRQHDEEIGPSVLKQSKERNSESVVEVLGDAMVEVLQWLRFLEMQWNWEWTQ